MRNGDGPHFGRAVLAPVLSGAEVCGSDRSEEFVVSTSTISFDSGTALLGCEVIEV